MEEQSKQLGLNFRDPTLPLDNMEDNIRCEDALFCEWPPCEAIVGNPPFLGGSKIRRTVGLGVAYLDRLRKHFPGANMGADLVSYWFRRSHDHLSDGCRAGLVATNTVREGFTRDNSTAYIIAKEGTITQAVSSQPWSGEAAIFVSIVNWIKQTGLDGPHRLVIDGVDYDRDIIHPHLQLFADVSEAEKLTANKMGATLAIKLGHEGYRLSKGQVLSELVADPKSRPHLRPFIGGTGLMTGKINEWVIAYEKKYSDQSRPPDSRALECLKKKVRPFVLQKAKNSSDNHTWYGRWWRFHTPCDDFFQLLGNKKRMIAIPATSSRGVFVFVDTRIVVNNSCYLFAYDDDYSFGILQSSLHWAWAQALGSKTEERTRYDKKVWQKFPWPQDMEASQVVAIAQAAQELRATRVEVMQAKQCHLRKAYQNADAVGPTHPIHRAQAKLDAAVREAYQIAANEDAIAFLLELNQFLAEDEAEGHTIQGSGLPEGLDPHDPRWWSKDCIQAPRLDHPVARFDDSEAA